MMNDEKRWEEFAMAIVEQAALDYHQSRFFLDTAVMRVYADESAKLAKINAAKRTLVDVETFFKNSWFETLISGKLNGPKAFEALKSTYETEVRPARMEKFLEHISEGGADND